MKLRREPLEDIQRITPVDPRIETAAAIQTRDHLVRIGHELNAQHLTLRIVDREQQFVVPLLIPANVALRDTPFVPRPLLLRIPVRALPTAVQHQVSVGASENRTLLAAVATMRERVVANLDVVAGFEVGVDVADLIVVVIEIKKTIIRVIDPLLQCHACNLHTFKMTRLAQLLFTKGQRKIRHLTLLPVQLLPHT